MPWRIPDADLERVKRETDLLALVRSRGIELAKHGTKDFIGRCPSCFELIKRSEPQESHLVASSEFVHLQMAHDFINVRSGLTSRSAKSG